MKHLKLLTRVHVNGRPFDPEDGVITVTDDQATALLATKQAEDVSADFPDVHDGVAGTAPIARPSKADAKAAKGAGTPVVTGSANGIVNPAEKDA